MSRYRVFARIVMALLLSCCGLSFAATETAPEKALLKHRLAEAISNADQLTLTLPQKNEVLLDLKSPFIGQEFLDHVSIVEDSDSFYDMCYGEAWITFSKSGIKKATVSYHHARSLRWRDGRWPSDAMLAGNSGAMLSQWFASKGYPALERGRLADIAFFEADVKKQRDFSSELPPATLKILVGKNAEFNREGTFARRVMMAAPDRPQLVACVFRAFGHIPTETRGYDSLMSVCREVVVLAEGPDLARALELVANDPIGLRGAAFLFCAVPYLKKIPPEAAAVWGDRLAEMVFATFDDSSKDDAILRLAYLPGPVDDPLLIAVASGQKNFSYTAHLNREYGQEPELVSAACLALAIRKYSGVAKLAQARLTAITDGPSREACEVALCLSSGNPALQPQVFKLQSFLIGYGGLEVLRGMPSDRVPAVLVGAAMDAPYGGVREEANELAEKLGIVRERREVKGNFDLVPVDDELARENPAEAITVYSDQLNLAIGSTKARLLRNRADAYRNIGKPDLAVVDLEAAREIDYLSVKKRDLGEALWQAGKTAEGIREVSSVYPLSDPEDLAARGIIHLANDDFAAAEQDLSAAVLIDSRRHYWQIFQHLAACLLKRPELSRIRLLEEKAIWGDEWTKEISCYLNGGVSSDALLVKAGQDSTSIGKRRLAEAYFYIAMKQRLAANTAVEREMLHRCVSQNQFGLTEHWLAVSRLERIEKTNRR